MNKKAVVLLSGGIDSTTCLAEAVKDYGSSEVLTLSFDYGQKHSKELTCSKKISEYYDVFHMILDAKNVYSLSDCSLLSQSTKNIKHESYAEQLAEIGGEGTVDTYVPFRNGLFLSYAAVIALSVNASVLYYGAHADDAAGRAYPDCTPEFVKAMNDAIYEGSGKVLRIVAPLLYMNKADVVSLGLKLKAPYQLTWSCYEGKDKPCGECGTCIDRQKAFELNGVKDPILEV